MKEDKHDVDSNKGFVDVSYGSGVSEFVSGGQTRRGWTGLKQNWVRRSVNCSFMNKHGCVRLCADGYRG